jgi:hypothetical protein
MPLDVTYPLADAIALILSHGREDREDQLADAIACNVSILIDS